MRNPFAKSHRVLGKTQAQWDAIKTALTAFFTANDQREDIPESEIRAVHADLVNDRVWNQIRNDMGL